VSETGKARNCVTHLASTSQYPLFLITTLAALPIALNRQFLWAGYFSFVAAVLFWLVLVRSSHSSKLASFVLLYRPLFLLLTIWTTWCLVGSGGHGVFVEAVTTELSALDENGFGFYKWVTGEPALLCFGYIAVFLTVYLLAGDVAAARVFYAGLLATMFAQLIGVGWRFIAVNEGAWPFTGTFINPNHFGIFILVLTAFLYAFGQRRLLSLPSRERGLFASIAEWGTSHTHGLVVLGALLAIGSGSRGVILILGVSVIMAAVAKRLRNAVSAVRLIALIALLFVLLVLALALLPVPNYAHADRIVVWRAVFENFSQYGVLGLGGGNFEFFFAEIKPLTLTPATYDHAHNDFIEILVEQGAIGLGLFLVTLGMWFAALQDVLRRHAQEKAWHRLVVGYVIGVSCLLMHAAIDFPLSLPGLVVFVLIATALLLRLSVERRNARNVS